MSLINDKLIEILQNVQRPGNFYASGSLEIFPPRLEVDGVGRIALPLLPAQAEQLVAVAERAPYGRGEETLVDTEVRRTWQINPERFEISGKHWRDDLARIVERVTTGLGVGGKVEAELYKLLVYDEGSFFVPHRDTEKAAGMFATLVIVLPAEYRGGELVVRHQGQAAELDLRREDPAEVAFAAFYADCVHEVKPITEGCRLTLIYNLLRKGKKALPKPPDYTRERTQAAALLRDWATSLNEGTDDGAPEKLVYLLEHAYTPAELSFDSLKNADAAAADVLVPAARDAECEIHLALVSIEESGTAEHTYYGGRGRRRYWDDDEDDFEIDEVYDRLERVAEWRRPDGKKAALPELPFSEDELCPVAAFEDMEPDELEFHEATGNEGASFDRTYRRAALVIWPRARHLAVLSQAGSTATLPYLEELCAHWEKAGAQAGSKILHDARTLAGYMLRDWPTAYQGGIQVPHQGEEADTYLNCLLRLGDTERLGEFWAMTAAGGLADKKSIPALVDTATVLPWQQVTAWLEKIVATSAARHAETCAALLLASSEATPERAGDLADAAQRLFDALPGDPAHAAEQLHRWDRAAVSVALVADTLVAFSAIAPALAEQTLDYFLSWLEHYEMDGILVPAALQLCEHKAGLPVVERLRERARAHLQARVDLPLEPPADWRREDAVACKCPDCAQLKNFLVDPAQSVWRFKGAESKRRHVQHSISSARADVGCTTEKRGRPYTLVCTKNQASYERRVTQRKQDLDALERLENGK